jgi:hypothetical protein
MPIPKPTGEEKESDFIGRCMGEIGGEYDQDQALAICYSTWKEKMSTEVTEEQQQGGVVSAGFGQSSFEYPPKSKEKLSDYMGRCMGDASVREKKKDRIGRAAFCYSQYQNNYIMSIARGWK